MHKKSTPTPIEAAVVLKCSPKTRDLVAEYSTDMGMTMRSVVDDAMRDWIMTTGRARRDFRNESRRFSQNENSA